MFLSFMSEIKKNKKIITALAVMLSIVCISGHAPGSVTFAGENLPEGEFCTFAVPADFVPSTEAGLFVNRYEPMESSSIKYSVYYNGEDFVPTNRQRQEEAANPLKKPADESENLTKEIYEETVSAAYNESYGENVGYKVESFKKIETDGYPGYRIDASYQLQGQQRVHQTVIMMLSRYRTFTVTYQRAEDDYCEDAFEQSISTIHVG